MLLAYHIAYTAAAPVRWRGGKANVSPISGSVELYQPKGDKVARALATATFAQRPVYAPVRDWSQMVIDEMELFPKGQYDDATDSVTQAISFLRGNGILQTDAEAAAAEIHTVMHRPRLKALYPC